MRDYAPSVLRGNNATLTLDVYPPRGIQQSQFTLYEDDGASNAYLTNGFGATTITCDPGREAVILRIARMQGDYAGKPLNRQWKLLLHLPSKPAGVSLNGGKTAWQYDDQKGIVRVDWKASPAQASQVEVALK